MAIIILVGQELALERKYALEESLSFCQVRNPSGDAKGQSPPPPLTTHSELASCVTLARTPPPLGVSCEVGGRLPASWACWRAT